MKLILGLIGKLSAGKGTVGQYLVEHHQATIVMFSQPLRDMLKRMHLPDSRINMQTLSQALRENFSQDILAKVIAQDVTESQASIVVVDGIRRPKDIEYLKKLANFNLIFIDTDQRLRYERVLKRGQNPGETAAELTFEQFQKNDSAEAESLIDEVAKEAKYTINNNGSKEELYNQVEDILNKLK